MSRSAVATFLSRHTQRATTLQQWLQVRREVLTNLNSSQTVRVEVVLGNTGADLDSCISAIALAVYRDEHKKSNADMCIPVINTARPDFVRAEVTEIFRRAGITLDDVTFVNDLAWDQARPCISGITLVDHNAPPQSELDLIQDIPVTAVFDHHAEANLYLTAEPRIIVVPTGSTASIIVNHVHAAGVSQSPLAQQFTAGVLRAECEAKESTEEHVWTLGDMLASAILWDTGNLGQVTNKLTRRDLLAIAQLGLGAWLDPNRIRSVVQAEEAYLQNLEFNNGLAEGLSEEAERELLQIILADPSTGQAEAVRTKLFKMITQKTTSIDHLSTRQRFKMDLKLVHCKWPGTDTTDIDPSIEIGLRSPGSSPDYLHIAIASVPMGLAQWLEAEPNFIQAADDFLIESRADVLVVLTLTVAGDTCARDLLLYSGSKEVCSRALRPMIGSASSSLMKSALQLSPLPLLTENDDGKVTQEARDAIIQVLGEGTALDPSGARHEATRQRLAPYLSKGHLYLFAVNNISQSRKQLIPQIEAAVASIGK